MSHKSTLDKVKPDYPWTARQKRRKESRGSAKRARKALRVVKVKVKVAAR